MQVPDDYEPPETTPQIGALRAYVGRREHADHDTFSCGRDFAEALLAEYDRLLYLAECKYELLASERGYDIVEYLDPKIRKLYMALNASARGDENDSDGDPAEPWNRLVEATATAMVHWLANARWAVIENRSAQRLRAAIIEARTILGDAFGHADAPHTPAALSALAVLSDIDVDPPEKPEGATRTKAEQFEDDVKMVLTVYDEHVREGGGEPGPWRHRLGEAVGMPWPAVPADPDVGFTERTP